MLRSNLPVFGAVIITTLLISLFQPLAFLKTVVQEETCQTFPETGKTVCDPFLRYWRQHGGLPIFGYPVSNPLDEISDLNGKTYTVQYFERAVFELHPENKPPYDVLLAQLGTFRFHNKYPSGEPGPPYTDHLPFYPDAQNIEVMHYNNGTDPDVVMTYVSEAKPDTVLAFYKEVMLKNRWTLLQQRYSDSLGFLYPRSAGETGYQIYVTVSTTKSNKTNVKVSLLIEGPM